MESVKGYIDHIVYQNPENTYVVLVLQTKTEQITCVGAFKGVDPGATVEINGTYTEHPIYGKQLKMVSFQVVAPEDEEAMERYLASGAVKGIGPAMAAKIVKAFGEDTFRIMEEEPERLAEIKGISERMARSFAMQMEEKRELREALVFLAGYGISGTLAIKIYNTYGMGLYGILQDNPYKLAEDIDGVGFRKADEIASRIGIKVDSEYRLRCGILYALSQACGEGHMYLYEEQLLEKAADMLGLPVSFMESQIENLAMDKKLIMKKGEGGRMVYLPSFYYAELACARMLVDLNVDMAPDRGLLSAKEADLEKRIRRLEKQQDITLDELQRQAVLQSMRHGVFILSGGPGTGKTTTINTMIRYFEAEGMDIFLAAPTGRAAKRMTEATGYEARTIHRMLEVNGARDEEKIARFEKNGDNPLEADVIIVDEMSMVDIFLFRALLEAILPGTRLILVGDMDQLPSVGPGQVLRDLMESKAFPSVLLQHIFRQQGESDIVWNAHLINEGKQISLDNQSKDFFFLERNDTSVIYKHMVQLIRDKLPSYVDAGPMDIQVLTPMRKGALGVESLNPILQEYLNPQEEGKKEHPFGENLIFREGDKVMQVKNNYQLEWQILGRFRIPIDHGMGVFNGDVGIVTEINDFSSTMTVRFDEGKEVIYPYSGLDELELAYAVTIHKSQGSEYPAVILPLLTGPKMLFNRNLLYTAVTRAKSCVTILGMASTLREMIDNAQVNRRNTSLRDRILEIIDAE